MNIKTSFISRLITGVKDGTTLKPAITPERISSIFTKNKEDIIGNNNINNNDDTLYNNYPHTLKDPMSKNYGSISDDLKSFLEKEDDQKKRRNESNKDGTDSYLLNNKEITKKHSDIKETDEEGYLPEPEKQSRKSSFLHSSKFKQTTSIESDNLPNEVNLNLIGKSDLEMSNRKSDISNKIDRSENNLLYKYIRNNPQNNEKIKRISDSTITINIGKITIRPINHNRNNIRSIANETRESNTKKLSLNDYLKKRLERKK
jgi:hypothetical protein